MHRFRTLLCGFIAGTPRLPDRLSLACCQVRTSCPHPSGPCVEYLRASARRPPETPSASRVIDKYSQSGRTRKTSLDGGLWGFLLLIKAGNRVSFSGYFSHISPYMGYVLSKKWPDMMQVRVCLAVPQERQSGLGKSHGKP